jgi:hypothetical protein
VSSSGPVAENECRQWSKWWSQGATSYNASLGVDVGPQSVLCVKARGVWFATTPSVSPIPRVQSRRFLQRRPSLG